MPWRSANFGKRCARTTRWLVHSRGQSFDPYPYILLNLAFSLQAAYAAPLILLAQTRQADRDKAAAENDAHHREALAQEFRIPGHLYVDAGRRRAASPAAAIRTIRSAGRRSDPPLAGPWAARSRLAAPVEKNP